MRIFQRTDAATIGGILIAAAGLFFGLKFEGIQIYEVGQATAALIVFCGTAGAMLMSTPLSESRLALKAVLNVFHTGGQTDEEIIERLIGFAKAARSRGLVSLEREAQAIEDPFLRKALCLAVDAVGIENMRGVLTSEMEGMKAKAENSAMFYETAAGYAPTLGMAGAAIGLVQVMKHLEHIDQVGKGVAAAFVATIYGVLLANLVLLPIATKLRARMEERLGACKLMLEGVMAIASGLNPVLIRLKLEALAQVEPQPSEASARRAASAYGV